MVLVILPKENKAEGLVAQVPILQGDLQSRTLENHTGIVYLDGLHISCIFYLSNLI